MNYREYLKAAHRHLSACKKLVDDSKQSGNSSENAVHWLNEAYYLSGYVGECLLSYIFFYDYDGDVKKHPEYKKNNNTFFSHSLTAKATALRRAKGGLLLGIPLVCSPDKKTTNNLMWDKWDIEYRYLPFDQWKIQNNKTGGNLSITDLEEYLRLIENLRTMVLVKFPVK
jgi:hypothetical protein